jgi:Mrp family chromosome partitioning ATPase
MITLTPDPAAQSAARRGPRSQVAEHYYSLVHWLRSVGEMSRVAPKSVGVTSCTAGSGVSTVASNLAMATASITDEPVLLLDMSVCRPGRPARFSALADVGPDGTLASDAHPCECVTPSHVPNLSLLTAFSEDDSQTLGMDTGKLSELLQSLEKEFGFIVVDLPPVESSLCFVAAGLLNGVLLVMEAERTRSGIANRAKQRLIDARASVLGVILNKHPQHLPHWLESRL